MEVSDFLKLYERLTQSLDEIEIFAERTSEASRAVLSLVLREDLRDLIEEAGREVFVRREMSQATWDFESRAQTVIEETQHLLTIDVSRN